MTDPPQKDSAASDPTRNASDVFPQVYDQLRSLAGRWFRRQPTPHTLQPTALVHEAYLRMARQSPEKWKSETHFAAVAATAMRQILVSHARERQSLRRGGDWRRVTLMEVDGSNPSEDSTDKEVDVEPLSFALVELERLSPRQSRIVELRFLGGLTVEQTARVMGIGARTVKLDWKMARAWLLRRLKEESS